MAPPLPPPISGSGKVGVGCDVTHRLSRSRAREGCHVGLDLYGSMSPCTLVRRFQIVMSSRLGVRARARDSMFMSEFGILLAGEQSSQTDERSTLFNNLLKIKRPNFSVNLFSYSLICFPPPSSLMRRAGMLGKRPASAGKSALALSLLR